MAPRDSFDCTPQQYHAGLDKLWAAMPRYVSSTDEDVFTLAAEEIGWLREALEDIAARSTGTTRLIAIAALDYRA